MRLKTLLAAVLSMGLTLGWGEAPEPVKPVAPALKARQPHWRPKILENYAEGQPQRVLFYEQIGNANEAPVKQILFFPNGQIRSEMDLIVVEEDSPGAKEWKSTIVPHGMSLSYFSSGQLERAAFYDRGLLHGEMKVFFSDGKLRGQCGFKQGERHGLMVSHFEDGTKAEEMVFEEDKIVGELVKYHPKGSRAALIPYEGGVPHGTAMEWYEGGMLRSMLRYQNGMLHSDGKNPAVVVYGEDRSIQEVQDFNQGQPIGMHVRYHANGKEAYKMQYKNGKKQGKELFLDGAGNLLGEGEYKEGIAIGKHWRNAEGGGLVFLANYDKEGVLLAPIQEFYAHGQKSAEYFLVEDKRHGAFLQWYENGSPHIAFNYDHGHFEGEQKEYYSNGQLKVKAVYHDNVKDGLFEEWYENGSPATCMSIKNGIKEGKCLEWYEDGSPKLEEYYVAGNLDKTRKMWHSNGKLHLIGDFAFGKKEGVHEEWNEVGDVITRIHYENDLPIGTAQLWYSKGKLKQSICFEKGKKQGKEEEYYPNGKQKVAAVYKDDKLDGEVKVWFEDGSLSAVKYFKEGVPVREHREYFSKEALAKTTGEKIKQPLQLMRFFKYNDAGQLDGEQHTYYPDGTVQTSVCYQNGDLHGVKAMWDQGGTLLEEAFYDKGKLNGRFFERARDGREIVYHYKENKREGLHEVYYPSHEYFGKLKALQVNFVNDLAEGDALEYNEAGVKIAVTPYVKGEKEGISQIFSPKGNVLMSIEFHQDKRHGPSIQYFPSGEIFVESHYINDLKDREEKTYYESGLLAKCIPYKNGVIHGLYQEWNDQGLLTFEGEYKEGKRHGKFNKFYESGNPRLMQTFADDVLDGIKKSFSEDGTVNESKFLRGKKIQ